MFVVWHSCHFFTQIVEEIVGVVVVEELPVPVVGVAVPREGYFSSGSDVVTEAVFNKSRCVYMKIVDVYFGQITIDLAL